MGNSISRPATVQPIQTKSMGRRDANSATDSGPQNSMATAMPNGIVSSAR